MALLQSLKNQGWYLTEKGLKLLTTDVETEDVQKIIKAALDWDLKEIGGGALPAKPESNGNITGRIVLQIQKMRNISAPKANEESSVSPRFLQLELTDGVNSILALELERLSNLNLKIPPGTKLYFKAEKLQLMQGLLVLKESEVQVLGGNVEHMVEKWELARQMQKYARSNRRLSGSGGPPPWIPFGQRLDAHKDALPQDRNFKSLQAANEKDKNAKENEEFNASRTQAIAEAAKAGQKKVFGGGQQNILDHNVKKILEKGYSEEDAKYALKTTNNNLERALYNLKRRNNRGASESVVKPAAVTTSMPRGRGAATIKEEASASKPQTNVSLFDFLTDKLPVTVSTSNTTESPPQVASNSSQYSKTTKETSKNSNSSNNNNSKPSSYGAGKFENNMSSSFAANRARPDEKPVQSSQPHSQQQRSNYNPREERKPNPPIKQGGRGGERTRNTQSNDKPPNQTSANNNVETPSSGTNNNSNNNVTHGTNSNRRNDRNERPPRKERDQQARQSTATSGGNYQANRRSQEYKSNENKPFQPRESNSRSTNENKNANSYQQNHNQQPKSNIMDAAIDKLADSTSKMSIQSKKEPSYNNTQVRGRHQSASTRSSNQPPQGKPGNNQTPSGQFIGSQNFTNKVAATNTQHQPGPTTYVSQMPNGFSYDPSKIMGFQTKEANEFAMNLLKSQGLLPQQTPVANAQQTQVQPPAPQQHSQPPMMATPQTTQPPAVAYMAQNPNNIFVAPPPQPAQMAQYGMIQPGGNWPWNIGDLCMAKYWEDGNYYKAKITAVSENTNVVLFLEYGNYEEVVRTDCLPLAEGQHHAINAFQAGPQSAIHAPMQQMHHSFQGAGGSAVGANQRYRSERQMYVPPAKRGANNN
ncbi:tudor domain-containing protein 3 [Stomoxys calcitrans]|uniref:tudor domain-containing protein 3 n=1 Tax=Stomoxys calcitrans TaxID=35570 RepID=UPI0027E2774B|nr:tudor domain-containing protein 3 [Stomoxys calcitrans]XP_013111485.2 tudor domain-containing protein 3 [Stomoxys calcitrans]